MTSIHKKNTQIQIADLIDESVAHVVARKQKALESEGFEIDLSNDENNDYSQIIGGGPGYTSWGRPVEA